MSNLYLVKQKRDKCLTLEVFIKPHPKQRPRFGRGITYTAKETKNFENILKSIFYKEIKKTFQGPVVLNCKFYYKHKKCGFKTTRPDLDNLIKSIMDAANRIVYNDDNQVFKINASKHNSDADKIFIRFYEV